MNFIINKQFACVTTISETGFHKQELIISKYYHLNINFCKKQFYIDLFKILTIYLILLN